MPQNNMWYVKHPFDCFVWDGEGGACAGKGWREGPPTLSGSASQTAGSRWRSAWGGRGLLPHTAYGGHLLPATRLMSGPRNVENRAHTGGPCSPAMNSPLGKNPKPQTTHSLIRLRGGGREDRVWENGLRGGLQEVTRGLTEECK